ncbi:MAG: 3-methyl-2-oxobutanoate hydroxymethyltransferase, partial [Candidatus Omnitrophica bacterium]|nr:3-methyl-2-oxobutanoate hydroxymethyltransferase [Candidatus Omnitrophota bacterium]
LGLESTNGVGIEEILYHTKAVTRAAAHALVIADMPFSAYQTEPDKAQGNAKRLIEEGGCDAVKVEWFNQCINVTQAIANAGIPVMGHIGLTPQTADKIGGFKVQGKDAERAAELFKQAKRFEEAGCFSIVLECVPDKIAELITEKLAIPTIGIGAGPYCDGQVLVLHDILGLSKGSKFKFVKQYTDVSAVVQGAIARYKNEVRNGSFPDNAHSFSISPEEFTKLKNSLPDEKEIR